MTVRELTFCATTGVARRSAGLPLLCAVYVVCKLSSVYAIPPGIPSRCVYIRDLEKEYPYPYQHHPWFKFVGNDFPRPAPRLVAKALKADGDYQKVELLQRIYSRNFLLKESLVKAARGAVGSPARLRLVLQKLINGEPISAVVLGGSIMAGGDIYHPRRDTDSFVGQLYTWIKTTFPHPDHKLRNGCLPATGSMFISTCLHDHVTDENVDLVILEFDINDSSPNGKWPGQDYMDNPWRRGLEIIIRRVLQYKNSPAIVYLHMWMPGFDQHSFWNSTIEDETEILIRYYELQSISFRNAIFRPFTENVPGFRDDDISCSYVHPTYLGHRYMGDMFIGFLQDELAQLMLDPAGPEDRALATMALPPPLIPNNYEYSTTCLQNGLLQKAVVRNSGWEWRDEPTKYGAHRPGFISDIPSSSIIFKLDTRNPHKRKRGVGYMARGDGTTVALSILKSYEGMGQGKVQCLRGCVCTNGTKLFDGTWKHKFSVRKWIYVGVSQSRACLIQVINRPTTSSGSHKIKISAVAVLPFDASVGYAFSASVWKPDDEEPPPFY